MDKLILVKLKFLNIVKYSATPRTLKAENL
jgi:hypothetical protein